MKGDQGEKVRNRERAKHYLRDTELDDLENSMKIEEDYLTVTGFPDRNVQKCANNLFLMDDFSLYFYMDIFKHFSTTSLRLKYSVFN